MVGRSQSFRKSLIMVFAEMRLTQDFGLPQQFKLRYRRNRLLPAYRNYRKKYPL